MKTLEQLQLKTGSVVYVELMDLKNTWPSDNLKASESAKKSKSENSVKIATQGIFNLGNTCYMNAALQCLANIKAMHQYYVEDQTFLSQINVNSIVGYKGHLVQAFGGIMQQMWTDQQIVVPKGFKHMISKINENFGGDDQQDTQEYINFLIDGIHEDTNLRLKKPYIPNPESEGRDYKDLALECWHNSLRRDWSFIFFMFYG